MIMHARVSLAFVGTELACENAGVKLSMHELVGCFRLSADQPGRGRANVCAIQIRANAATKCSHIAGFAQACVGTRRTDLFAKREGVKDFGVILRVLTISSRMTAQHGFNHCNIHECSNGFDAPRVAVTSL